MRQSIWCSFSKPGNFISDCWWNLPLHILCFCSCMQAKEHTSTLSCAIHNSILNVSLWFAACLNQNGFGWKSMVREIYFWKGASLILGNICKVLTVGIINKPQTRLLKHNNLPGIFLTIRGHFMTNVITLGAVRKFPTFFFKRTLYVRGRGLICVRMMYTEKSIDVLLAACRALWLRYMYLQHILSVWQD